VGTPDESFGDKAYYDSSCHKGEKSPVKSFPHIIPLPLEYGFKNRRKNFFF
jgi:hypothetical protein